MGKRKEFTEEEINTMLKMYNNDFESTNTIAIVFNVDPSVIVSRLEKIGVNIPKGSPYSKQYWVERGLNENKIEDHIRTLRPVNIEYWIKNGYTEEEAILQIEGQKMVSLRGCIARFGEKKGIKKWEEREGKRSAAGKLGSANIQYWLNKGYSESEAVIKRKERQTTFSLEKCVEKYGEEKGLIKFNERQVKWQKTLYKNGKLKSGYSEVSQELFYKLIEGVEINEYNYLLFAKKGGEFVLNDDNGFYRYDFTDLKNKRIIEYNGDDYHGNPNKYNADDFPNPFRKDLSAKDIWNKDKKKEIIANNNGFEVFVVWDSEYKKNKQEITNKCKNFLKNGNK
jgi:hypothetical protein